MPNSHPVASKATEVPNPDEMADTMQMHYTVQKTCTWYYISTKISNPDEMADEMQTYCTVTWKIRSTIKAESGKLQ